VTSSLVVNDLKHCNACRKAGRMQNNFQSSEYLEGINSNPKKYYSGDQIKEDEMDGTYSMHGR
jgi:hypothetical protein